jgi:hypothetical protein
VSTSSFGPAAQAANSSAVPVSSNAHLAADLIDKRPPRVCLSILPRSHASDQRRTKYSGGAFGLSRVGGSSLQN